MTKNFKISFDPENGEHRKMLKYIANQDNICGFLWELQHNFPRSIRKSQVELTGEEVLEKLRELMDDENLIDIDEMEKTSKNNETAQLGIGAFSSRFVLITYLTYIIIWEAMVLGGFGYVVFGLGKSGWWMLLAVFISSRAYKPESWRKLLNGS